MGIIRNHLQQMKVEQPEEYRRLMEGYETEEEFVKEALGMSEKAVDYYESTKEGNWNK
jgi:hypothetical protein